MITKTTTAKGSPQKLELEFIHLPYHSIIYVKHVDRIGWTMKNKKKRYALSTQYRYFRCWKISYKTGKNSQVSLYTVNLKEYTMQVNHTLKGSDY